MSPDAELDPGRPRPAEEGRPAGGPPGSGTFTIEGRQAPALFVVGWVAPIAGAGLLAIVIMGSGGIAGLALGLLGLALLSGGLIAGAGSQAIERRAKGVAGYAGPSPFLVFAAVVPLTILVQSLAALPLAIVHFDTGSPLAALLGLLLTAAVYLGLVRLLVVGTGSLSWAEMGVRRPGPTAPVELAYGAVLGIGLVFLTGILASVLADFLAVPEATLPSSGGFLGGLLNLVTAAIIAPIAEEIYFRGFSTTAWWRSIGANPAIVRGALFFAAAHVLTVGGASFGEGAEHALFAFIVRIPVALALGWVFVRRGSLIAAIGLHSAFNGLPVLLLLLSGR
jgi:membrane protease YdiL (CAAX protease family)